MSLCSMSAKLASYTIEGTYSIVGVRGLGSTSESTVISLVLNCTFHGSESTRCDYKMLLGEK